jgi:hypothetical protein
MADAPIDAGMVGPFWVVEERGSAVVVAHCYVARTAAAAYEV